MISEPLRRKKKTAVLVETLIAVVFMAVAMNFLVQFTVRGTQESAAAYKRTKAALFAQEKIEEILLARDDIEGWEKRTADRYPSDNRDGFRLHPLNAGEDLRWRWVIEPAEDSLALRATLKVLWDSPGHPEREESFELSTLFIGKSGRANR